MFRSSLTALLLFSPVLRADQPLRRVAYATQVKPILSEKCYSCHGALKQQSGLRLETLALMLRGGEGGPAIVLGNSEASPLVDRITAVDDERMPPESEGSALTTDEVALIREWINQGAESPDEPIPAAAEDHWAFQPFVRPSVPEVSKAGWSRNPIDAFLNRQHQLHGLSPQAEASRIILLRRLHLDLIGIPPTTAEIAACEQDESPHWYEHTVQRLLHDPRYGERWARHWMDIWRYSDWWGLGAQLRNSQRHIWHWRDWVVDSLNNDTPYDEMVRLMLAADELHPNDLDKLRATGFLARNYFLFNRPQWMEETVEHVSKGLLGLTMNCARCHDHKYDPIEQTDFYRMRAFFEPYHVRLDVVPGEADLMRDGIPRVFDGLPDEPTYRYVRGDEENPDKSEVIQPGVPKVLQFRSLEIRPVSLPLEAWQPERRPWVVKALLAAARKKIELSEAELMKANQQLADAKTSAGKSLGPKASTAAQLADVTAAQLVAEANVALAYAESVSIERRVKAIRAGSKDKQFKHAEAVRAERQVAVAKARHGVAVAEQGLLRAADDQKGKAEKTLKTAREALTKAQSAVDAEVKPTDQFTPFVGAKWTPTRFLNSRRDDPTVHFHPQSTGRRTALARWMTDRRNPLTARVAVNHIWARHMGQPLVPTVFDFGRNGTPPAHPDLLDWLAAELMDNAWSMKHLHNLIVTSAAYRMSSSIAGAEDNLATDTDNRYWWRRVPTRLESQVVRDSILALAGTLDSSMGGPPVPRDQQAKSTRRSLYFFHSNNERNLFLTTFDEALVKECYRREQSIVPQQALALTNSALVLDAAQNIAQRLSTESTDEAVFVRKAFAVVLGITASELEFETSRKAIDQWRELPGGSTNRARTNFVWALINHNDFIMLR